MEDRHPAKDWPELMQLVGDLGHHAEVANRPYIQCITILYLLPDTSCHPPSHAGSVGCEVFPVGGQAFTQPSPSSRYTRTISHEVHTR